MLVLVLVPMFSFGETLDVTFYQIGIENFNNQNYSKACDYLGQAADYNENNLWARLYYVYSLLKLNRRKEAQKWIPVLAPLSETPQYKELMSLMNPVKEVIKPSVQEKEKSTTMTFETSTLELETKSISVSSYSYNYDYNFNSKHNSPSKPKVKKTKLDEAKELIDLDETDKAVNIINSELKKNKKNGKAYELLGLAYYNKQDYKKCIDNMNKAFSNGVNNFDSYFMAAEASANLQKTDDALKWYLKANEKNKKDTFVRLAIADIYCSKAEYKKADAIYKDVLATDKNNLDAEVGLADIELEKGFTKAALEHVNNILKEVPDSGKARFLKARILLEEKEYAFALEEAQVAYSYNPANVEYKVFSSLVKVRNLLSKEAIVELNELLKEFPNNVYVLVTLGEALLTDNQIKEGKEVLLKADIIKKIPQTSELLALIEASEGNYDKAEALYKEFCTRSGNNPKSLLAYAEFIEIKQDYALTMKAYKEIIDKYPETPFAEKAKQALEKVKGLSNIKPGADHGLYH